MMKKLTLGLISFLFVFLWSLPTFAGDPVKIGMITTLSTGGGYLGEDIRDGFLLAMKQRGNKLGGIPVELLAEDDGRNPQKGKQIAERFIKRENIDILTGIVFSNVALAVVPSVVRQDIIYVSPNAGPSKLAGKGCHRNYFNVAWQNDNLHEAMGQYVTDQGYKKMYILAPNYPAGKDALTGFKRFFKGNILAESYTKLGATDYASEIAKIRSSKPDGIFFFLPGGMGINFMKQFGLAGMKEKIPVFGPAFSFDQRILKAVGKSSLGVFNSSQWNKDIDNPVNRRFVADFQQAYGRLPTLYASQGYDAALLIGAGLSTVRGNTSNKDGLRRGLKKADFLSVRGPFKFGSNNHPIQDIYVRQVIEEKGGLTNKIVGKVFTKHQDAYVGNCQMK